jgi:hypothetical protein
MAQFAPHPYMGLDPVLAANDDGTHPANKVILDGHEYRDTLSSSSSSDDFGPTSIAESSSPASSLGSDLQDDTDEGKHFEVQLPEPFYPPSMAQADNKFDVKPRALPFDLGLPLVPQGKASIAIDPQDKCVFFADDLSEIS